MDIIEEYKNQARWRNWEGYLSKIPIGKNDVVLDLGCSLGAVSDLFAGRAAKVIGIDNNTEFINYCRSKKKDNQLFFSGNIDDFDYSKFNHVTGVWSSFTFSYLKDPGGVIRKIFNFLPEGGWLAVVDVACFISGNLDPENSYFNRVKEFELNSHKQGVYDFNFGSKMETILQKSGFEIVFCDNDVTDPELNFNGPAPNDVIKNWQARMERMAGIKKLLAENFYDFSAQFISCLSDPSHKKNRNVRFVVAVKK